MGILATVAGLGGIIQGQLLINHISKKKVNFSEIILLSCNEFRMRKIKFKKNQNEDQVN